MDTACPVIAPLEANDPPDIAPETLKLPLDIAPETFKLPNVPTVVKLEFTIVDFNVVPPNDRHQLQHWHLLVVHFRLW